VIGVFAFTASHSGYGALDYGKLFLNTANFTRLPFPCSMLIAYELPTLPDG
jgi:hypothetical protein